MGNRILTCHGVFYPIMLGIGGFIGGALMGLLYNLAAKRTGEIELKFGG